MYYSTWQRLYTSIGTGMPLGKLIKATHGEISLIIYTMAVSEKREFDNQAKKNVLDKWVPGSPGALFK